MSSSEVHQQQPGEPFPVTLSRGGAPAFALSPTKQLAFGIHHGSLSPAVAAQLLTQQKADPNGRYYDAALNRWDSLLHLAADRCVGEDGAAMLRCLIGSGADMDYTSRSPGRAMHIILTSKRPLDFLLDRLDHADPAQLSALLPMIETFLRHGATCCYGGSGALTSVFTSDATRGGTQRISATECLEVVSRLTTAAAAAPTPPSLYGASALNEACECHFREEEDGQQQQQQQQQQGDAAHGGHTDVHIAILEKIVEGMGQEEMEGGRGSGALNSAVASQNRAIMYWLVRQRGVTADSETLSVAHWDMDVMSWLVDEAGADVDGGGGLPPLVALVRGGHHAAAHHLIHLGASVDTALTFTTPLALIDISTTPRERHRILSVYHSYVNRSVPTHAMRHINTSLNPLRTLSALSASHRVFRVGVLCCQIASYVEPPPLPFSERTPLGRRLNAALSFFLSRAYNVASPSVRRRLFRHTAFVTPQVTHTGTSDSQGGEGDGDVEEGVVYGVRDVIHLIRCEEGRHYELPHIVRGFGNGRPFECEFDGNVVVGGAGGGQRVVQRIDGWEGMSERGPPGAVWGEELSDGDGLGGDELDEEDDIDEDFLDEDDLEDGWGDGLDEGFMDEDGMYADWGERKQPGGD
ncbi:unnamed protein product [Vitrella brassicaformis CCMP3155]|uniref:Uncharacterized protein n=1 Tax=Vitrella brassicaformis (strain CCMP3155) TaxID=1169540 RepID=A0A0G4H1Y0_VITBC|nr:unnamed protein product [Vitrella brassicaformis CCMP3155]|eukprot:CEM37638.1 unnamed protein product [Vitrella brassicaformis CCMP3155]